MALPSTIHRVAIDLSDIDCERYARLEATVARHPSETAERLVLRILAYALCFEEDLVFTKGIAAGDEPDLWVKGPDGRVRKWIEVGLPDPERLRKASRHAEQLVLVAGGSGLRRWIDQHQPKLVTLANLLILTLDPILINRLAETLERTVEWSVTITEGSLYLTNGSETLESPVTIVQGIRRTSL
ncbi:MAG: YaeQ family protein [Desulfuromonas sp.]|nr:YaeQ family protein [Desulfuromonas sp.]